MSNDINFWNFVPSAKFLILKLVSLMLARIYLLKRIKVFNSEKSKVTVQFVNNGEHSNACTRMAITTYTPIIS